VTWFSGESRVALFIELLLIYICAANWGVGLCDLQQKNLEILAKDRSDVAAGCSKRW
jgi:hypothetical protein